MKKDRLNVYFDPSLSPELDALAARRKVSKSQIIEAALASYLSPDTADQREAAITRRLDRLTRAVERLERDVTIGNEAVALFVRFWLTTTPPLPDTMREAAQAKGRERYEGFVETLGRRLAKGSALATELSQDVGGVHSEK
ncbi:ribbon-helix-helix domain-containing protein [Hyphomonas pacifica]|uniref:CopG family transcriptional regulator n=1 Tax=Hyphomonas pacifica TaxID=1280941 RepID=A0A062U548_9PROT|nr:CopG family transcriptional regulator [Hyphomonas pacifica]KCZ51255.1 CopG family transcripitonal regulator [Hyphomonas pacifica]RAN33538.1 CopG family transcriptional regulator [Hyphomonas pacifica]